MTGCKCVNQAVALVTANVTALQTTRCNLPPQVHWVSEPARQQQLLRTANVINHSRQIRVLIKHSHYQLGAVPYVCYVSLGFLKKGLKDHQIPHLIGHEEPNYAVAMPTFDSTLTLSRKGIRKTNYANHPKITFVPFI